MNDVQEIEHQQLPLSLELTSSDDDLPLQPAGIKLFFIQKTGNRYCYTPESANATHYAIMPVSLRNYFECAWEIYALPEGLSSYCLRAELDLKEIKRVKRRHLFLERELDDLLSLRLEGVGEDWEREKPFLGKFVQWPFHKNKIILGEDQGPEG